MRKLIVLTLLIISTQLVKAQTNPQTFFTPGVPPKSQSYSATMRVDTTSGITDSLRNHYFSNGNKWNLFYSAAQENKRFFKFTDTIGFLSKYTLTPQVVHSQIAFFDNLALSAGHSFTVGDGTNGTNFGTSTFKIFSSGHETDYEFNLVTNKNLTGGFQQSIQSQAGTFTQNSTQFWGNSGRSSDTVAYAWDIRAAIATAGAGYFLLSGGNTANGSNTFTGGNTFSPVSGVVATTISSGGGANSLNIQASNASSPNSVINFSNTGLTSVEMGLSTGSGAGGDIYYQWHSISSAISLSPSNNGDMYNEAGNYFAKNTGDSRGITNTHFLTLGASIFPYSTYTAFGNSLSVAVGATSAANGYVGRIGTHVNLTPTVYGVSGDQTADQQKVIYPFSVTNNSNQLITLEITNDINYGLDVNKEANFTAMNLAAAAYLAIPATNKVLGQSGGVTYTGSWSNSTYYGGAISKQSTTNGDQLSLSVSGTQILVAYTLLDGNTGTANVTVDGGAPIAINCFGQAGTAISTTNGSTNGSAGLLVTGLSNTSHTVVITVTSSTGAGNKVIFDWAAGNSNLYPVSGQPTVLESDIPQRFTSTAVPVYSLIVKQNLQLLKTFGLNIYQVYIQNVFNKYSQTSTSGSHPNNAGYYPLYNPFRAVIDSLTVPANIFNQVSQNAAINGSLNVVDNTSTGSLYTPIVNSGSTLYGVSLQSGTNMTVPGVGVSVANQIVSQTTGNYQALAITPTYNVASGTGTYSDIYSNRSEAAISGTNRVLDLNVNGSPVIQIDRAGLTNLPGSFINGLRTSGNISGGAFGTTGVNFNTGAANYTDTLSTGTVALAAINTFGVPTLINTAGGATYTSFTNLYVPGAAIAGSGVSGTSYAVYVAGGRVFLGQGMQTSTTTATSNFAVPGSSNGANATTTASVLPTGASTLTYRALFNGTGATTLSTSNAYANVVLGNNAITTAATGTQGFITNLMVLAPSITGGGSTNPNSASIYINGQSGVATNNYSLFVYQPTSGKTWFKYGEVRQSALRVDSVANITGNLGVTGNVTLAAAGNKLVITEGTNGRVGVTTLSSGTIAITISGLTTSSRAFVTRTVASGTALTTGVTAVCTSNTLTITADVAAGTINTADGSTYNYFVIN